MGVLRVDVSNGWVLRGEGDQGETHKQPAAASSPVHRLRKRHTNTQVKALSIKSYKYICKYTCHLLLPLRVTILGHFSSACFVLSMT
jgi:hypothetical protein